MNESEICAVAETIGAGPCEVNTAFPNTFLGPWLFPSQKINYWGFFYNYSHCTGLLHWKMICVASVLFYVRVQKLLQFHCATTH